MRPILKPKLPDSLFAVPPSHLLLQSFGEYCSVSEQPLPSRHHVWHKRLGVEMSAPAPQAYWNDLLLLSENSFLAQLGKPPLPWLRFPDNEYELTFSFTGASQFRYELTPVVVIVRDSQGNNVSQNKDKVVIVSGNNSEANDTIEYFALNSQFYIASDFTFVIPLQARRTAFERRVTQRTQAWHTAVEFAQAWRGTLDTAREDVNVQQMLIGQGRRLAAATGYWSTWASALLHEQLPVTTIRDILLSPFGHQVDWGRGPGPHNPYPGTNAQVP
jgi:hypothetical protein